MARKKRPHSKAERAITPAQRAFFEHLNGSNAHPAPQAVTNAPQTEDEPHVFDRSIKREKLGPIPSQANRRGRLPDYYQPYTLHPRDGDYWPPLNNLGIRSDFYRPNRRRSRSPARYDRAHRVRTPSRESRAKAVKPVGSCLHSEDYIGESSVHGRYRSRAASRERDMRRSNQCNDEPNRRSGRHNSPSPLTGLDTHHREPNPTEDLRVTLIVHMPERMGSVNSSESQPAVANFGRVTTSTQELNPISLTLALDVQCSDGEEL